MIVDRGLLAILEAKPGQEDALGDFLVQGRALAVQEQGTVTWYAFRVSHSEFGIFDTFVGEPARQAHLDGQIPAALGAVAADLLAKEPDIKLIGIVAAK